MVKKHVSIYARASFVGLVLLGATLPASAKFGAFSVPGIGHIDLTDPVRPVQPDPVHIGPVVVTPPAPSPIPTPPSVQVQGNGEIAKPINAADQINQAPGQAAQAVAGKATDGISHAGEEIGKSVMDPWGWKKKVDELAGKVADSIPKILDGTEKFGTKAVLIFAAAIFGTILLSVLISSMVTALVLRRRLPAK